MAAVTRTILFAGGGTGGHLFPGIAVARALRERDPSIRPLFLCTARPIDRTILEPTGFEWVAQPIIPPTRSIGGLLKFWRSWRETRDLLDRTLAQVHPLAAVGLGGYAAGAAVKLAAKAGIPSAILNPDVIPGKANRYLMQHAAVVCCQFDQTAEHTPPQLRPKLRTTGCPVRAELLRLPPRQESAARLGLDPRRRTLVITGASQGAQTVNEAALETFRQMQVDGWRMESEGWQVLHLAGKDHADVVRDQYRQLALSARVIDFTEAMWDVWSVADLCIARSGAGTCAELTAAGVPSILMPYPFHRDMHQRANAKVLADAGAALILDDLRDRRQNARRLRPMLERLLRDDRARSEMSRKARSLARPDAADRVAELLLGLPAVR